MSSLRDDHVTLLYLEPREGGAGAPAARPGGQPDQGREEGAGARGHGAVVRLRHGPGEHRCEVGAELSEWPSLLLVSIKGVIPVIYTLHTMFKHKHRILIKYESNSI